MTGPQNGWANPREKLSEAVITALLYVQKTPDLDKDFSVIRERLDKLVEEWLS